jgi:hypothetical protein
MLEMIGILIVLVLVIMSLIRDRPEEPPAHMEGGSSHLRSRRPPPDR